MATLTINDEQILTLVRQLPDERRAWLFRQLLQEQWPEWSALSTYAATRVQEVAAERGLNWSNMSDNERENLIDAILHEND